MITTFVLTSIFLFYIFIGYPLLIGFLGTRSELKRKNGGGHLSVTAIIVACNEAEVIGKKLQSLLNLNYPVSNLRIVVVDDASTDDTYAVATSVNDPRISAIRAPMRCGKAAGINAAMLHVKSDLVLMLDARQEIDANALLNLASWFEGESSVGAVSGELLFKDAGQNDFSRGMDSYWRYEKFIRKSEAQYCSVPGVTGAIYLLRTKTFAPIPDDTILDDVLIPMRCIAAGYSVGFDDRAIAWDIPSNDPAREKRRKIRTIKGNYQLLFRYPLWMLPSGHPIWWQYLSHKILRLAAPFLAFGGFFACIELSREGNAFAAAYSTAFIVSILLYPLSLIFPAMLNHKPVRLLVSFVALNWFNLLGFFNYFFAGKSQAWKK